jgi:uncharacterized protein (TIGR02453 family)
MRRTLRFLSMLFTGFGKQATQLLTDLEANNNRDWFLAHRARYDDELRAPMEHLLADLAEEFGEAKVFRPNRDVRFSKDKTPYKTNIAAVVASHGGALYLSVETWGLFIGGGYYHMARDQLDRFRTTIATDERAATALDRVLADVVSDGAEPGGEQLATAPRGYPRDHPRIDLLRRKGLIAGWQHPARAWLSTAKARDRVADAWRGLDPVLSWLGEHVGPSTEDRWSR